MAFDEKDCEKSDVDCEAGRRAGCATYCCRLLVRLDPEERVPNEIEGLPPKGYVDKDKEGYCIHHDKETHRCHIWDKRPRVCREYSCNPDPLLQITLREGFQSVVQLAKRAVELQIPKDQYIRIPCHSDQDDDTD